MNHFLIFVSILLQSLAVVAAPLKFFAYETSSEKADRWESVLEADPKTSSEVLGLFTDKSDPKQKLMVFRRSAAGDKVCEREKIAKNQAKKKNASETYQVISAPRGWSCAFRAKSLGVETLTGIRTYFIKGKNRSLPFAVVVSTENVSEKRFLEILNSTKESNR